MQPRTLVPAMAQLLDALLDLVVIRAGIERVVLQLVHERTCELELGGLRLR